jgi:virginiamycin A acetyltransferase
MPSSPNSFPDPCQKYPVSLPDGSTHQGTVFLSAAVDHPRMEVGIYTYASAHAAPEDWAARLAPYLYEFSPERLVIGKFCQIADGVQFITASANHRYDGHIYLSICDIWLWLNGGTPVHAQCRTGYRNRQ